MGNYCRHRFDCSVEFQGELAPPQNINNGENGKNINQRPIRGFMKKRSRHSTQFATVLMHMLTAAVFPVERLLQGLGCTGDDVFNIFFNYMHVF